MIRDVFKKLVSIFKEIKFQEFELALHEDSNSGLINISVRAIGKCTPPLFKDPLDLLRETKSKIIFSTEEYEKILSSVLENQKRIIEKKFKKQLVLIKHQFSEQLNEPLIVYKELDSGQINIKAAKEIYFKLEKLKQFSSEDCACIGHIIGCHETEQDFKLVKEKKTSNVIMFDILSKQN